MKNSLLLPALILVSSFIVPGVMTVSAQYVSKNPCTSSDPCTNQICGDHICASGEYDKWRLAVSKAQSNSTLQKNIVQKVTGMQNTTMQNTTMQNTTMQNTTMQNTTMQNMQNTTIGGAENNQAIPEFGPIASLVLVIAIVSVIAVTGKTRVFLKL